MGIESINAITFRVKDMARSIDFYLALSFELRFGGSDEKFSSLASGSCFVNLMVADPVETGWGRVIFHVDDVDTLFELALAAGLTAQAPPRDAPWGERMFAIFDPDGHDLSFARPLSPAADDHGH
jgi:catechol 2,3-dioxygenase-like lactoylglutathione lyase family enzyme